MAFQLVWAGPGEVVYSGQTELACFVGAALVTSCILCCSVRLQGLRDAAPV